MLPAPNMTKYLFDNNFSSNGILKAFTKIITFSKHITTFSSPQKSGFQRYVAIIKIIPKILVPVTNFLLNDYIQYSAKALSEFYGT